MTAGGAIPPAFLRSNIRIIQMTQMITKTIETIRDTYRFYNTIYQLQCLNDKELQDLGLTRQEIVFVAAKAITTK
jgi:uncharacterized protein YjiS (DUF1127 family)